MSKSVPPATRAELDATIAEIRAKVADGWAIEKFWFVVDTEDGGWRTEQRWIERWNGNREYRPRNGHDRFPGEPEAYHVAMATQRNRRLLKHAIKPISAHVTGVREVI
jgi:hypothetical protein